MATEIINPYRDLKGSQRERLRREYARAQSKWLQSKDATIVYGNLIRLEMLEMLFGRDFFKQNGGKA